MDSSLSAPTPDVLLAQARFVSALARDLLSDEHQAEDLAQETWLRFLRRPPRASGAARSWLRAATWRLSIEGLRARARRAAREERAARPEALPSVADELARTEVLRSVAEAVLALDEPYRTTVLLAYWRSWDAPRIARETGTSTATVRSRLQRAHRKLRERLDRSRGREAWVLALSSLAPGRGLALGAGTLLAAGVVLAAGLLLLWAERDRGEELELARLGSSEPIPAPIEDAPGPGPGEEPLPGARSALGTAPVVVRISGSVSDRPCAELALPARPSAGLALRLRLDESATPMGRAPLAEATARTDVQGRFAFELARPGAERVFLRLSSDEDESYRRLWFAAELTGSTAELALARAPHGVLHGSVIDELGQPLAGVDLQVGESAVRSGHDGAFAIPNARITRKVDLHASSPRALLGWEGAQPLDEGGFAPLCVRLGPGASLRLSVTDRSGAGIAGVGVRAALPECEQASIGMNADERVLAGRTDEEGVVLLERLWAGRKLRLELESGREHFACEAMEAGRLLLASARVGRPIVVEAGAELALEARLEVERDVAGEVRLADGGPVPRARVELADLGRGTAWNRPVLLQLETDEAGRFAGRLRTAELVGPLRVTASATELAPAREGGERRLLGLGYAGPRNLPDVDSLEMPAVRVDLAPDDEDLVRLVLTLGPRHAIRGTVLGRDGAPLARLAMGGSRVWAAPAGSAYHGHGVQALAIEGRPGVFEIPGLEPGRYDLFVSEELESFYSFANFLHRFPAIEAGAGEVELRLPERREVRIRVRLGGAALAAEPSSAIVLHRKLFPAHALEARPAQRVEHVSGARGWPEGAAFGFAGIGGSATELGRTSDGYDAFEGREHALQPLEPGGYALGVHASGAEGEAGFFPQATPILWFEEGEYVVDFEPLPAATLRGRVVGDAAGEFLALALAGEDGALVPLAPLEGFTHASRIIDTSASGEFVLHRAPTGSFRLRAGTRAELQRGQFRLELPLRLQPGENPRLDVRL